MVLARFFFKKPAAQSDDSATGDTAAVAVAVMPADVASATKR